MHHLDGHGEYRLTETEFSQARGDVVLLDSELSCDVVHPEETRIVRWSLPEAALEPFVSGRQRISAHQFKVDDGLTPVLARNMDLLAELESELDVPAKSAMVAHLCGLVGIALDHARRPDLRSLPHRKTLQRQRILNHVDAHFRDARLTARRTADALGISTRWLHALLEDSPTGFADLVAGRRLELCMALLRDPGHRHRTVSEIAFAAGFNDLSTFYRRFRTRYGASPGSVRAKGMKE